MFSYTNVYGTPLKEADAYRLAPLGEFFANIFYDSFEKMVCHANYFHIYDKKDKESADYKKVMNNSGKKRGMKHEITEL